MNDFSTVCRLCINPTASNVEDEQIYQQINLCLGLVINPTNKSWPCRICGSCAKKVREFHKYRELCWDVHNMLLNVLNGDSLDSHNGHSTTKNVMKKGDETTNSCSDEVTDDPSDTKPTKAQSNVVICEICGKTMLPTYYQGHLNEHNGLKPFACVAPGCSKMFSCRHGLRRHSYYRHSGQMFLCQDCGKAYKSKLELSTHRLHVHTRGKAFGCEECGKSFVTRSYLTTHRKAHTGGPQVQCSYCPKMLYSKKGLKLHELLHTNEQLFACAKCSSKFSTKRQLDGHVQRGCANRGSGHSANSYQPITAKVLDAS